MAARRWIGRGAAAVVVAAAVVAAAVALGRGTDDRGSTAGAATGTGTAVVERTTLTRRETVNGTLGYAGKRSVVSRVGRGTLTALAREGSTVRRGGRLYAVDGDAVRLMYGTVPMYRALSEGISDGPDVLQLERNLAALGHDPGTVDDDFDDDTTAAVREWQEANDVEETGEVELRQLVFQPGARRIGQAKTAIGAPVADGAAIMDTTSLRQVVAIELDTVQQELARRRDRVVVTLPSGRTARGRVRSVGSVAHPKPDEDGESDASTITVTVSLDSQRRAGRLDQAPVTVGLASEVAEDVLAAPVTALIVAQGGGYAVQVRRATGVETVRVETGVFASGMVELRGDVREGDRVVIPGAI